MTTKQELARRVAFFVLFFPRGMKRWAWYQATLNRIKSEVGVDLMVHEAQQEAHWQLLSGATVQETIRHTETYLRGLWRPRFDNTYVSAEPIPQPLTIVLEIGHTDPPSVNQQEGEVEAHLKRELTERQFELVVTAANIGQAEAAKLLGVPKQNVNRALAKARRVTNP